MDVPRLLGILLVVGGILVAVLACNATGAFGARLTEAVANYPLDAAAWYILGGLALSLLGGILLRHPHSGRV